MASEALVRGEPAGLIEHITIEQMKYMQQQVHKLLDEVMQEGIDNDYAIIPGTKKKSLLKPGAEKISNLFRFVVTPRVEEFRDGEDVTFRVYVALSSASGRLLGEGLGQASTKETKFAWRKAVCEEEYEDAEPSKRRLKWIVDDRNGDAKTILQVRENPADKENNMLKIGKKRALIDAILTVTGCSNLFTQDREEEEMDGNGHTSEARSHAKKTAPANDQGPIISPKQAGRFYGIWKNTPRDPADVKLYLERVCGIDDSRKMAVKFYDEACRWAATKEPVPGAPVTSHANGGGAAAPNPEEAEARTAFSILGWDAKTQARFVEQYAGDWKKVLSEAKILVVKKEERDAQ